MIKLIDSDKEFEKVVSVTNGILESKALLAALQAVPEITERNGMSVQGIYDLIQHELIEKTYLVGFRFFRPKNPWSKVVAYVADDGKPLIYVSTKFYTGKVADLSGTLAHELGHEPLGFTHPTYRFTKKEVPYVLGSVVQDIAEGLEGQSTLSVPVIA